MSDNLPVTTNLNPYSSNDVVVQNNAAGFGSVETQRALAEVQIAYMMAKQFPRNPEKCVENMLLECQRKTFADRALYSYARGGTNITGLSIRALEMIERNWQNIESGFRVFERRDGISYMQAFACDRENGVRKTREFQVKQWRDTKQGGYLLKDERDIRELEANYAQRNVRSCIEALIPADVKDAVHDAVLMTLHATADISKEGIKKLLDTFLDVGVNKKMIEARIQRKIESIEAAQVVGLRTVYSSLKDGMSAVETWFDVTLADEKAKELTVKKEEKKAKTLDTFKQENAVQATQEKLVEQEAVKTEVVAKKNLSAGTCPQCEGANCITEEDVETGEIFDIACPSCQKPKEGGLL